MGRPRLYATAADRQRAYRQRRAGRRRVVAALHAIAVAQGPRRAAARRRRWARILARLQSTK